jgi:anaerobic magnesium-protoporphyrin IX monomethyl ester cyclase
MKKAVIPIIAIQEQDNLGVGYLASVLIDAGYDISVIDIREEKENIYYNLKKIRPSIIGFSVVFSHHIHIFSELISYLRNEGMMCHFTAGGQYASLCYAELFSLIPSLDSVVRFDGEYPFLDLVNCIQNNRDWKNTPNLVYKTSAGLVINKLREPETDLDRYPFPMRSPLSEYAFGKKFATILAGRGCCYNCLFCSEREYGIQSSGPLKRFRKPGKVAEETEHLYREEDCSVFLFQDDDFPLKPVRKDWVREFCRELRKRELSQSIMWKINCRIDEVDYERFALMKKHGLFLVFLGIENGTDEGLALMNKHCTTSQIKNAVAILKKLGIGIDYGYIPFHPWSTFSTVRENFVFLKEIFGDGYAGAAFMKMIPYYETPLKKILEKEKRLIVRNGESDYDFIDDRLNDYYNLIIRLFATWTWHPDGFLSISKWTRNLLLVYSKYYGKGQFIVRFQNDFTKIMIESNQFILDALIRYSHEFEEGTFDITETESLEKEVNSLHEEYCNRLKKIMKGISVIGEFQRLTGNSFEYV